MTEVRGRETTMAATPMTALVEFQIRKENAAMEEWLAEYRVGIHVA